VRAWGGGAPKVRPKTAPAVVHAAGERPQGYEDSALRYMCWERGEKDQKGVAGSCKDGMKGKRLG
jgi:hypothetical protein